MAGKRKPPNTRPKEDEARWRAIMDQSRQFIGLVSIDGTLIEVNRAALELVGTSAAAVLNRPLWETPWWTHSAALQERLRAAIRTAAAGEPVRFEATHLAADGSLRDVDFSLQPVKDQTGRVLFLVPEGNDITDRKKAEEELRIFMESVENSSDAVGMSTPEGRHYYQNHAFDDLFGAVGEKPAESVYVDPAVGQEVFRAIMAGGQWTGEVKMYARDGRILDTLLRAYANKDKSGRITALVGIHTDITERKRAEEALKASEAFLNSIIEQSPFPMIVYDAAGRVIRFNKVARNQIQIPDEKPLDQYTLFQDEQLREQGHLPLIERVFRHGETVRFLNRYEPKQLSVPQMHSGDRLYLDSTLFPIKDKHGGVTGAVVCHLDMTERERTEEALRESQATFRDLFAKSADAILLIDQSGVFVECNQAALNLLKMPREAFLNRPPEMISPEFQPNGRRSDEAAQDMIDQAYAKGLHRFDWTCVNSEGGEFIVEVSLMPIVISGQTMLHTTWRDITERKKAEEELRIFMESVENSSDAVGMSTPEGRHYYQNHAFDELFGPVGEKPAESVYVDPAVGQEVFQTIIAGGQWTGEVKMYARDGRILDILLRAYANKDKSGRITALVGIHTNITERKRMENALQQSEERLALAMAVKNEGIWDWNLVTNSTFFDERYYNMAGYAVDEFPQDFAGWASHVHPDDLPGTDAAIKAYLVGESARFDTEFRFQRKDGSWMWIQGRGKVTERDESGMPLRMIGTHTDITERKRSEDALRVNEERYRSLFEGTSEAIFIVRDNSIIASNSMAVMMYGCVSKEDFALEPPWQMSPPLQPDGRDSLEKARELMDAALAGTPQRSYWKHTRKNGALFDAEVSLCRIDAGGEVFVQALVRDITEPSRLANENQVLANIIKRSQDFIGVADTEQNAFFVNPAGQAMVGLDGDEAVKRTRITAYFLDEDLPFVEGTILPTLLSEGRWSGEFRFRHFKTGAPIPVLYDLFLTEDPQTGRPTNITTITRDITERKRAEEALRESERRYRELVTHANSVILRMDNEGRITFFNEFAQRLFGYTEDEVLGQSVVGTIVPETDSTGRNLRNMILDIARKPGLYAQNENENMCRDGSRVWISWTNTPVLNAEGETLEVLCIGNDITARKWAEEQIKESEAAVQRKLKAIVEPDGDLGALELADIIDRDVFRLVMEAFHRITGIASAIIDTRGEVLVGVGWQDICTRFHRCHPETLKNCIESDTHLTQDVVPGTFKTYRCKNNLIDMSTPIVFNNRHLGNFFIGQYLYDDDSHDISLFLRQARQYGFDEKEYAAAYERVPRFKKETAKAIMSFYFELTRIITHLSFSNIQFARNLAGRKQAEEERERLQSQLVQAQKMESVGRLAGGVAHDFNNMLGVILGHTDMALERVRPEDPLHGELEEVRKAAQRSADLTRQLLAFARRQTVAPRVLDLNETVEGMLKLLLRLIGEAIELLWKPGHEVWPVKMDPAQLDQILANLCVNARDAIAGVGKVTIETRNASFDEAYCIHHPGFIPGEYVMLAVNDDGCGMDAETVSRIFEPFFTTKELGKGTGLGLATVYGSVKQNNGFISVYSEPGHGTSFKIYLPRHAAKAVPDKAESKPQPLARGSETILLVEDEPAILGMTKVLLERLGYAVLAASSPSEAIRLAREYSGRIDLLMTDLILPEMNGRDLADTLLSIYHDMRRLFMSGYTADIIAHHGALEEGVHFIQKPFSMKDLAARIREALGKA